MATLDGPITMGSQLIIPEKSVAWFELLRLEWGAKKDEPRFIEEMGRTAVPVLAGDEIPAELVAALGPDPKWSGLRVAKTTWPALLTTLGLSPAKYDLSANVIRRDQMKNIVVETGKYLIYVGAETLFFRPAYPTFSGVVFILEDGPGLVVTNAAEVTSLQLSDLPKAVAEKVGTGIMVKPVSGK